MNLGLNQLEGPASFVTSWQVFYGGISEKWEKERRQQALVSSE